MTANIITPEFGIMKKETMGGRLGLLLSGMYRFRAVGVLGVVFVLLSVAIRIALLLQSITDVDMTAGDLFAIFGTGLFYDVVTFSYIMVALVIYLALVPEKSLRLPCAPVCAREHVFCFFAGVCLYRLRRICILDGI